MKHIFFLPECNAYNDIRDKYLKEITDRYPVFDTFNNMVKIIFLFNNVEPFICRSVAAYVNTYMSKRKEQL